MGEPGMPAGEVIGEVVIEDPGANLRHLVELSEGDATADAEIRAWRRRRTAGRTSSS